MIYHFKYNFFWGQMGQLNEKLVVNFSNNHYLSLRKRIKKSFVNCRLINQYMIMSSIYVTIYF